MKVGLPFPSSDMFNRNDEEISSIIWGGTDETGDHIVPCPKGREEDGHKNLQNQESLAIKLAENNLSGAKCDSLGIRPESSSASCCNGGISPLGMDLWPNMASSKVVNTDYALLDDEVLSDSSLMNNYRSIDICSQDEDLTYFVEYGWENIGIFDDLDRIFRKDEPIFATVALGNSDKIWSSSKYSTNSPPKSFSINPDPPFMGSEILSRTSENMGVKANYRQQSGQSSYPCFEKMEHSVSLSLPLKNAISDLSECGGDDSNVSVSDMVPRSSNYESGEFKCQAVLPSYVIDSSDIDSTGKPFGSPGKPPLMVPKEKIERLRRWEQMQTMLAIQKQLQQFGNQASHDFIAQKSALESRNLLTSGSSYEFNSLGTLSSIEVLSSIEQDESGTFFAAVNCYSMEETVLHCLHQIVSKLDMAVRISIRDSMFRLAESAVQRLQTTKVNSSTNRREQPDVVVVEENDASEREFKATDIETYTNPMDRVVAHLFFHRPTENSTKQPETPDSSTSAKLNLHLCSQGGADLPMVESGKSSKTELTLSTQDKASSCTQHMDCMDASENGPAYIPLEGGAMEVVASR